MWKNLALMLSVLVASSAYAQDAELVFAALDGDDDGSVSAEEARANQLVSANFSEAALFGRIHGCFRRGLSLSKIENKVGALEPICRTDRL